MKLVFRFAIVALSIVALVVSSASSADEKLKVLIVDGQNNHNWKATTPVLKTILEDCGRFTVDVATSPEKGKKDDLAKFRPEFAKYAAVLSNYNGELWSEAAQKDLEAYVKEGKGGLVIIHAANNSFGKWTEYKNMIGMGWYDKNSGDRLKLDNEGKQIRVPKGEGDGPGHRYSGKFTVTLRKADHPITKGMPMEWMHNNDELYDNMRGPIQNIDLLATAFSKGTMAHEPMIWTVTYGKGRVFHTPMGHDVNAMKCIGFAVTVQRGTEWSATGNVTIPIPKNFPTDKDVSITKEDKK